MNFEEFNKKMEHLEKERQRAWQHIKNIEQAEMLVWEDYTEDK